MQYVYLYVYAFFSNWVQTVSFIQNYMYQTISNHECQVSMAKETMAYRHNFMAVNKKNPFVMDLNKAYTNNSSD